jgi:transposase InsO family protein
LTKPRRPQTNGRGERFNGRISEVLATHRFDSRKAQEATIQRYVWLYNHHIPQEALGHVSPIGAMKRWYAENEQSEFQRSQKHEICIKNATESSGT